MNFLTINQSSVILILLLSLFYVGNYSFAAQQKVLIITHSYNRPEFIEMQYQTFKKFLKDEYTFVVFNDANTDAMAQQIAVMCERYAIVCIRIPQEIHDRPYLPRLPKDSLHRPNVRHANVVQYSLDTLGFEFDGIVGIVDSDLFIVKPLSLNECMVECDILAAKRGSSDEVIYFWPGFVFFKMDALPDRRTMNFNCGLVGDLSVDSGGWTHYYIAQHRSVRITWVDEIFGGDLFCPDRFSPVRVARSARAEIAALKKKGFDDDQIAFLQQKPDTIEFLFGNRFLHYRAGTNYDNQTDTYLVRKRDSINNYINTIMRK